MPSPPHHDPPRLFLIDGYALLYRAFFAMISRPLRTSKGENTSAAWGVANFLLRLRETYRPDYVAWVHDAGDSFRTEKYPEYKSTREKLDAELQADFDVAVRRVEELLQAFNVSLIAVPGYEADDVIGTLAVHAAEQGCQAVIVSGDKDFYQLIGPRVALLNPGRGGPAAVDEQWVDAANAAERLGVPPGQVVDYLALVGDSSDNIPGVRGVGDKGARTLLGEYGDLDTILARADEVKGKRAREALQSQGDAARLSRELVTIRRDVPVALDLEALADREPDRESLARLLAELEFFTLVRRVGLAEAPVDEASDPAAPADAEELLVVTDSAALEAAVRRLRAAPEIALEVWASSPRPREAELIGLALAGGTGGAWYFPLAHRPADGPLAAPAPVANLPALTAAGCRPLRELLEDPEVPKAGHDLKYALQVLRGAGVELGGDPLDSMLASFVLDPGRRSHALDTLAVEHLGHGLRRAADLLGKGKSERAPAEVAVADAGALAASRCAAVLRLRERFGPALEELALAPLLDRVETPLVRVLADMEWAGIAVDRALFARLSREFGDELAELERSIYRAAGQEFNVNSPKQLAVVLFERQQLPVIKRTKTGPSTDADVLEELAAQGHEVPSLLLAYRELIKLKSTYVDVLPESVNPATGRIHTTFNQTGASTGRLSSSDPNLQNVPVRTQRGEVIRRGFVPGPGCRFVVADYSQIELRLMAHLSEDPAFIEAFQRGGDIHRQTAAVIFGVEAGEVSPEMRARAKTINFATIYGQGPFALSRQLGITMDEAKQFIAQYFERFAGVRAYLDRQIELAREQGFVETLLGRRRYIPDIKDKNFNRRSFAERTAQNTPLQGSAADLIKLAMIQIHEALKAEGLEGRLLLQVHDELLLEAPGTEVPRVMELVRGHMESAVTLRVPLVVDLGVGDNWLDAKRQDEPSGTVTPARAPG